MLQRFLIKHKIKKSLKAIMDAYAKFGIDNVALAWTGGKDSTLLLWFAQQIDKDIHCGLPKIMFINEGDVFKEVMRFAEKLSTDWKFKYEIVQNDDVLKQVKKLEDMVSVSKLNKRNREELGKLIKRDLSYWLN